MSEGNILVIDDEKTMCNLLKDSLSEQGYNVTTTQKARNGLQHARNNLFDLIITDLKMPKINGIEIMRRIKEFDPDNMVIVITGYPSFETVQEALRLGAYDYITKPFNLEEISFIVKRAVEFRRLQLANKKLMKELAEENIILEKKVEERTGDLKKLYHNMQSAYMATVKALAQAIDAKDHYTHSHSQNVTKYAVAIAKEMGFSQRKVNTLEEACQLHDLGKIGIHDYILNKSEKLTQEEWEEIRSHSLRGAEILEPLTFLDDVIILIRQHHERYDGTGYPNGLRGEEIELGARIIAVADAFDAMISERPYRNAYSKEYTISKLKETSGTQFDPQVVKAFLEVLKKEPGIV
ncbi:MAG: HD domain-containing phosphohydrolase [Candidatus Lokiarchaeia archaeon]